MARNIGGLVFFALGIVLLIIGFNQLESLRAEFARLFTGNAADRSFWLVMVGAIAVIGGLVLAYRGTRRT